MKKYIIIIFLIIGFNCLGSELNVQTKTFDDGKEIWIHLPDNYNKSSLDYPVIFVFDGQILFNYICGLYEYNYDKYPPAIIIGIKQEDRGNEFIRQDDELSQKVYSQFDEYISKSLTHYIDSNYRTNSIKIGIGHSHGGTFLLNNMLSKKTFTVGICISPSLWTNKYEIFENYKSIQKKSELSFQLYLGYGEDDYNEIKKGVGNLNQLLLADSDSKIQLHVDEYVNEDHNSAILIGSRKGLGYIFKDYIFPDNKWNLLEESGHDSIFYSHYKELSEKFNCPIIPSEDDYNSLGYYFLEQNRVDDALRIFEKNINLYPYSSNVFDSYADALEVKEDFEKAFKFCQKALNTERETDNNRFQIQQYEEHLQRLEKAMVK